MDKSILVLILTNVVLTSLAQIVLKTGMSNHAVLASLDGGLRLGSFGIVLTNPYVVLGLVMYFGSAFIWLIILSRVEVSLAYPFVGIGFVLTMILAALFHGDAIGTGRIVGTLLISAGVAVLARS